MSNSRARFALWLAERGLSVLGTREGKPDRPDSLSRATRNFTQVEKLFRSGSPAVGVATGQISSCICLEIDSADGGQASMERLVADYGPLPETLAGGDPAGRSFHFFKLPRGAKESQSPLSLSGLRVLGDGDFAVVDTGNGDPGVGRWRIGAALELADPPAWLVEHVCGRPLPKPRKAMRNDSPPPAATTEPDAPRAIVTPSPSGQIDPAERKLLEDRALWLAEKGLSVFPLGGYAETPPDWFIKDHDGDIEKARQGWPKRPRVAWKQFQTVPAGEEQIREWWAKWPTANIGIACGNLIVVDADSAEAVQWCEAHLPHTPWRVKTAKGEHFYFRADPNGPRIGNSADGPTGIDVRGWGGYVVAAGSRHHSGAYYLDDTDRELDPRHLVVSDLPIFTSEELETIVRHRNSGSQMIGGDVGNLAGFDSGRVRVKADGSPVPEGGRNNAAASLAGQYMRDGLSLRDTKRLLDDWNAKNPSPLSGNELNTVIASIKHTHDANHPDRPVPLEPPPRAPALAKSRATAQPFPKHLLQPPGLVGEIATYITHTAIKPQPVLSLAAALTLCGTIMGRKVRTQSNLRTNIYTIAIGASGSGKEHPRKAIKRLLKAADALPMLVGENLASDAGLFSALYKSPAGIVMTDEIGRFLASATGRNAPPHVAAVLTLLMQFSGSADTHVMEKVRAEVRDMDCRRIEQPNLCLMGSTVPESLFKSLGPEDLTNGFLPRLLPFFSDDPDPYNQRLATEPPPSALIESISAWAKRTANAYPTGDNIADLIPNPLWVGFSPDAQTVFDNFETANRVRKAQTRGTGIDAMWSRADEHAKRLALIVGCGCDFENPVIEREHAEWACELVAFLYERTILEIDDRLGENEHELNVKRVLSMIRKRHPEPIPKWRLGKNLKTMTKTYLASILEKLIEDREIVAHETSGIGPNGQGRAGVAYGIAATS